MNGDPEHSVGAGAQVIAALAIGVLQLGVAISLAALIFSGPLAAGAGRAAAGFVLGTAIVSFIVGWASRMPIVVAGAQDTAAIVLAAIAGSMVSTGAMTPESQVPTVIVLIALSALLTGVAFWVLASRGLTNFVRYLPWPVITGFTAGTGWLLIRGGVEVMHGSAIEFSEIPDLFTWHNLKLILPGLGLAVLVVVVLRSRLPNTLISLAILLGAILFHLVGRSVSTIGAIEDAGWLIGPFPEEGRWQPVGPSDLAAADWGALMGQAVPIIAVVAVSVVGLLLNLSGLEPIVDAEIEMDHEVRLTGISNLGVALSGGLIGWHLIGDTALARRLGARGRFLPCVVAAMALAVFLLGAEVIGLMPRLVAGGVLAGLGLSLLDDWARSTMPRLNRTDRMLSALILAAIAILGILPGVALGVLVSTMVFILRYSRIDPARHVIDAAGRSNVDRRSHERRFLSACSGSILAIELQGFLFFGSTMKLRSILEDKGLVNDASGTQFVIIDLDRVTGVDSTAATGLATIVTRLSGYEITTVWSSLDESMAEELRGNGVDVGEPQADLDHAIAWCEDQLLIHVDDAVDAAPDSGVMSTELANVMDRRSVSSGQKLITAGDDDRELYFVEAGTLTAWVTSDAGRVTRLRQVLPGAVLGEVAFCRGGLRTADVIADTEAEIMALSRADFDAIASDRPDLAIELQDLLLGRLADRLADTSAMVRDLMR